VKWSGLGTWPFQSTIPTWMDCWPTYRAWDRSIEASKWVQHYWLLSGRTYKLLTRRCLSLVMKDCFYMLWHKVEWTPSWYLNRNPFLVDFLSIKQILFLRQNFFLTTMRNRLIIVIQRTNFIWTKNQPLCCHSPDF